MIEDLRVNGILFHELSYAAAFLEMYRGDILRELQLEFSPDDGYIREFSTRFLDILGNFQYLRKLKIVLEWEEDMVFPLFKLFHILPDLQMLSVLGLSLQVCTNCRKSRPIGSLNSYVLNLD